MLFAATLQTVIEGAAWTPEAGGLVLQNYEFLTAKSDVLQHTSTVPIGFIYSIFTY